MQFPKNIISSARFRSISTNNVEDLAQFQIKKNRSYTQLQAGVQNSYYAEANLGEVQIFREKLSVGSRIEASPADVFVPFAFVFPRSGDFRFCGKTHQENTIIQASGGAWDVCFKDSLDYVCTAFECSSLKYNYEKLTGRSLPQEWLTSQPVITYPDALLRYSHGVAKILREVQDRPAILKSTEAQRTLNAEVLKLALDALNPTIDLTDTIALQTNRIRGVRRVIDFLQAHADQVPTIAQLCDIAELSERSLEYGFREYLDITPIRYLRIVRLNGVRRDLLNITNHKTQVSDIALKWGFVEFGRFAGEYKQMFDELPSETMRKSKD
jgi:AraC family ethanolamine operon transcriptional activator